jgi:hypothetical protein
MNGAAWVAGLLIGAIIAITWYVVSTHEEQCFTDSCVGCVNDCLDSEVTQ